MKIMHHITNTWNQHQKKLLKDFGIDIDRNDGSAFQLEEGELYFSIVPLLREWEKIDPVTDATYTVFTKQEVDSSEILALKGGLSTPGYPEPSGDMNWRKQVYGDKPYCCGIGAEQVASFTISAKTERCNKSLFQLNWEHDKIFAQKDFYDEFLVNIVGSRPVLVRKRKESYESEKVVQLDIPMSSAKASGQPMDKNDFCPTCNVSRFVPYLKGFIHLDNYEPESEIFTTSDYFGAGYKSFHRVFVTGKLKNMLIEKKIVNRRHLIPVVIN